MRQGVILMICLFIANFIHSENLSLVGNETNDLYRWLLEEKVDVKRYNTAVEAVEAAQKNGKSEVAQAKKAKIEKTDNTRHPASQWI